MELFYPSTLKGLEVALGCPDSQDFEQCLDRSYQLSFYYFACSLHDQLLISLGTQVRKLGVNRRHLD